MSNFEVKSIGKIVVNEEETCLVLDRQYIPALQGLEGFGHINVLWWFSELDNEEIRQTVEVPKPYKTAPEVMGIFATRSPVRPNPIALTAAQVLYIDYERGIVGLAYIDAHDGTPLLDIKPYTPSYDKIEHPTVPQWCSHWPKNTEESGAFNWENEFNF